MSFSAASEAMPFPCQTPFPKHILRSDDSEFLSWLGAIAVDEIAGEGTLLSFQLNFQKFERTVLGATD